MDNAFSALTIIVLALAIFCLYLLSREWSRREKQIADLLKRVRDLEKANLQRLPYRSYEELLNAMAAIDKELGERSFYISLLENAKGHIANAMKAGTKREKDT